MKLNLKYYSGKDIYSDGDIENKIIKYIKSGKSVDEIFQKDNSWPVYYHLAKTRENIINWYPFKKNSSVLEIGAGMGAITSLLCENCKEVVSIESSKRRAEAISERCKEFNNLEIIVGNFNDIKINKKFDYITLIGVFEYALMFAENKNNAYVDFLKNVKKLLKPNGKILIAIENRFGLKYWCGAKEDHTNIVFDSINNYINDNKNVRTFSKKDFEEIFDEVKLKSNFYYPLPDYKFPELILTDKILKENNNHQYNPYYSSRFNMFANEKNIFKDILKNGELPFFSNSYFIELTEKQSPLEIEYVKFNNYRFPKYATITYKKGNKYYKKAIYDEGIKHISNLNEYYNILISHGVNTVKVVKEHDESYTPSVKKCYSLQDKLNDLYLNNKIKEVYSEINKYINYLKKHFKQEKEVKDTIFNKYGIKITNKLKNKLTFVKDGFIDLCFQNLLLDNNEYVAIDQEWYLENVPLEYIIYRSIHLFVFSNLDIPNKSELYQNILDNISIDIKEYTELFDKLEISFINSVINYDSNRKTYDKYLYAFNSNDISKNITDVIDNYDFYVNYKNEIELKNELINEQKNEIDKMIRLIHEKDDQFVSLGNNYNALEKQKNLIENQKNVLENELKRLNNSFFIKVLRKLHLIKK